jgi:hypothetical protein
VALSPGRTLSTMSVVSVVGRSLTKPSSLNSCYF